MAEPIADVATAVALGRRGRQEDAVVADFADGAESGFAVLSDGMGGHDDGDLASRIIVAEVFGALSLSNRDCDPMVNDIPERLREAVALANLGLRNEIEAGAGRTGMGGTVVATLVKEDRLHWISVGDSTLYLYRGGRLHQLNEVHTLASQIDLMVEKGMMDAEAGWHHPQRDYLTSAVVGSEISLVDCPRDPIRLRRGDIVLMASDGLHALGDWKKQAILRKHRHKPAQRIARALIEAVADVTDPEQDNVSVAVIKPALRRRPVPLVVLDAVERALVKASARPRLTGALGPGLAREAKRSVP